MSLRYYVEICNKTIVIMW